MIKTKDKMKYNLYDIRKGKRPDIFKEILGLRTHCFLYCNKTIEFILDYDPLYLIKNQNELGLNNLFIEYVKEVNRFRINIFCSQKCSLKEYVDKYFGSRETRFDGHMDDWKFEMYSIKIENNP